MELRYFDISEFDSPDAPGSGAKMDEEFLIDIDRARHIADIPFYITSGYRTDERNDRVGGVKNSAHTKGLACDISAPGSRNRYKIITALHEVGITRIGIGEDFVHGDIDHEKDQNVMWLY